MEIDLTGRVALITGGSKGIGLATARAFAAHGAAVMISSRKEDQLLAALDEIDGDAAHFAANAGDPEQARACIDATLDRFGQIDILMNNAATNPYAGPLVDVDLPRFDKIIGTNLRGPLVWTQEVWRRHMKEAGGSIINMVSVGAFTSVGAIGVYNLSKAALVFLTQHLATELGPTVRVNAIAPGLVKTESARALWEKHGEDADHPWPLRRIGAADDIAGAALFLASELSSWVTGEVLVVDGGAMVARTAIR